MPTYCVPDDVRAVIAPDGDGLGTAAELSDATLNQCIADATQEVDARLSARYSVVPFKDGHPIPAEVQTLTRDIAAYLATLIRRKGLDLAPTDPVVLRYTRAQALLTAISKGQANLIELDGSFDTTTTGTMIGVPRGDGQMFSLDTFSLGYDWGTGQVGSWGPGW